ncbi:MAG: hypothetical protein ABW033_03385 [Acidimicrobiia bacterium]
MRLVALALVVACCAGACSGGADEGATPTTTTSASSTPAPDPTCTQFRGTDGPLATSGDRPEALLVDAYVEQVGCLDRVTYEFESLGDGTPPGYTVGYRDLEQEPLLDAAGARISLPASTALVVTFAPARSTDPRAPEAPATYKGNLRLSYGETHHIDVVQKLDDVNGTVVWVIGLDSPRPFTVDSATAPTRVSVYIG